MKSILFHFNSNNPELVLAREMLNGEYGSSDADVFVIFTEDDSNNSGGVAYGAQVCSKDRGTRVAIVEGLHDEWTALVRFLFTNCRPYRYNFFAPLTYMMPFLFFQTHTSSNFEVRTH